MDDRPHFPFIHQLLEGRDDADIEQAERRFARYLNIMSEVAAGSDRIQNTARRVKRRKLAPEHIFSNLVLGGSPDRNTPRIREMCQTGDEKLRAFIDARVANQPSNDNRSKITPPTEEGGKYDPSVYTMIRAKRARYEDEQDVAAFDKGVQEASRTLGRKKAA